MTTTWARAGMQLKAFNAEQPRDFHGRWIKVGSRVRVNLIAGGGDGTVTAVHPRGRFDVALDDGTTEQNIRGEYLTVIDQTPAADRPAQPHAASSPKDIDTALADIDRRRWLATQAEGGADKALEFAQKRLTRHDASPYSPPGDRAALAEAVTAAQTRQNAARAALAALDAEALPLQQEYRRRPWPRAWIVLNTGGHAHRGDPRYGGRPHCSTTYETTKFGWLPDVAGQDDTRLVESLGETACTTCYPDAPAAALNRPRTVFAWQEKEAAAEKAKADAEKAAKNTANDAKKITAPDGSPLLRGDDKWDVISSVTTAQNEYMAAVADAAVHTANAARLAQAAPAGPTDPAFAELAANGARTLDHERELAARYTRYAEKYLAALAAKRGISPEELRAELAPKAHARIRKELRAYQHSDIGPYKATKALTWERAGMRLEVKAAGRGAPPATQWTRVGLRLQTKAADAGFEHLHPRGANGRFIKIGGRVRLSPMVGGGDGTVEAINPNGWGITVKLDTGGSREFDKRHITVLDPAAAAADPAAARPYGKDAERLTGAGMPTVDMPTVTVPPLATGTAPPGPAAPTTKPASPTVGTPAGGDPLADPAAALSRWDAATLDAFAADAEQWNKQSTFRDGPRDEVLEKIAAARGFDGPPTVTEELPADGQTLYRGVGTAANVDKFITGPYFGGTGVNGSGTYVTNRRSYAVGAETDTPGRGTNYAGPNGEALMEMQLRPGARIGTMRAIDDWIDSLPDGPLKTTINGDTGRAAALLGYDAFTVRTPGHKTVIINRAAVTVRRPPAPDVPTETVPPLAASAAPAETGGPGLDPHTLNIAPGAGWPVWPPPSADMPELTPGQAIAARYWKTLPTGTRTELETRLGQAHPAAVPSVEKLVEGGMDQAAAAKANMKATKAAYMKAYDQRLKLRAALDTMDARERHLPDPAAANTPPTAEKMRLMSDAELADALGRFAADEKTLDGLIAELERRDTPGADPGNNTPEQDRIDSLIAGGMSLDEAIAEVYQVSADTIAQRNQAGATAAERQQGETLDQVAARLYGEWVDMETVAAENATRGNLLSPAGKRAGVDPGTLFSGSAAAARKYASEELKRWWAESGHPRRTLTEFKADTLGRATDRAAAAATRAQGNGRDFGL